MNGAAQHIWRTFLAGVLFLAPLALLLWVGLSLLRALAALLNPIAAHLPFGSLLGLPAPDIAAAILLLAITYLAGLVARTTLARALSRRAERMILRKIPGYTLMKSVAHGAIGDSEGVKVGLANIDDAWLIAFIMEAEHDGLLTVFVPSAPTPTAGSVYFLRPDQVRPVNVSVAAAVQCIMQLGVGSQAILEPHREPGAAAPTVRLPATGQAAPSPRPSSTSTAP